MTRQELADSLNLKSDYVPASRANRPRTIIEPEFLTVYESECVARGADAIAHTRYLIHSEGRPRPYKSPSSWHYTVDDARVINHLPLNEEGYHANAFVNSQSLAVVMCRNEEGVSAATMDRTARLLAVLLHDFSWSVQRIAKHHGQTSSGEAPEHLHESLNLLSSGIRWNDFLARVNGVLESIDGTRHGNQSLASDYREGPLSLVSETGAVGGEQHQAIEIPKEFMNLPDKVITCPDEVASSLGARC